MDDHKYFIEFGKTGLGRNGLSARPGGREIYSLEAADSTAS
jgi:hypothetical protein